MEAKKVGLTLVFVGQALILTQGVVHILTSGSSLFGSDVTEYGVAIAIALIAVTDLTFAIPGVAARKVAVFLAALGFSAALYIGGGWTVGTVYGLVGTGAVVYGN